MGKAIYENYLKEKRIQLAFLVLVIGLGVAISGLSPYVFGEVIDIFSGEKQGNFKTWILFYALLLLLSQLFSVLESLTGQWIVTSIENRMESRLMGRVLQFKSRSADGYEKGELLNRLEFDIETVGDYYIDLVSSILMIGVNLAISVYFVFRISMELSIISVLFFPLMYLVNFAFQGRVRQQEAQQKRIGDQYYSFVGSLFAFLNPVKTFGIQDRMQERFEIFLKRRFQIEMKNVGLTSGISMLRSLLSSALNVILLTISGIFITQGKMSVGSLVAFNSYLDMLFQAVSKMLELNLNRQSVVVSYERIRELEERELETEMDGRYILQERIQEVALQQVQFAYRQEEPVLERLSCSVEEAGLYSLVGKNGCGKTTILKLLERLYDPDEGQVCINGRDIREYQISALRSRIAYMEKEPFFIRGTVYENLRMGNEEVSEEQMEEACKRTGIHRDIMEMDQQYRTVLEESGRNLSSGQKQKLGLARLFLRKNVSLYLLDEITSDLDGSAERQIADQLEELTRDTIVFSVSHKEELLKRSKCIFLIYGGKIVESGTHEELMEESRQYQKLYRPKE